jgi:hypothetical protein
MAARHADRRGVLRRLLETVPADLDAALTKATCFFTQFLRQRTSLRPVPSLNFKTFCRLPRPICYLLQHCGVLLGPILMSPFDLMPLPAFGFGPDCFERPVIA